MVGEYQLEGCEEDTKTQEDMSVPVDLAGGDGGDWVLRKDGFHEKLFSCDLFYPLALMSINLISF